MRRALASTTFKERYKSTFVSGVFEDFFGRDFFDGVRIFFSMYLRSGGSVRVNRGRVRVVSQMKR